MSRCLRIIFRTIQDQRKMTASTELWELEAFTIYKSALRILLRDIRFWRKGHFNESTAFRRSFLLIAATWLYPLNTISWTYQYYFPPDSRIPLVAFVLNTFVFSSLPTETWSPPIRAVAIRGYRLRMPLRRANTAWTYTYLLVHSYTNASEIAADLAITRFREASEVDLDTVKVETINESSH